MRSSPAEPRKSINRRRESAGGATSLLTAVLVEVVERNFRPEHPAVTTAAGPFRYQVRSRHGSDMPVQNFTADDGPAISARSCNSSGICARSEEPERFRKISRNSRRSVTLR